MKFITCVTKHTTGEVFADAMKIKDNEVYAIIEAMDMEHAREIAKQNIKCPACGSYSLKVEEIVMADTKRKIGETIICTNCNKDGVRPTI